MQYQYRGQSIDTGVPKYRKLCLYAIDIGCIELSIELSAGGYHVSNSTLNVGIRVD
jgi:hypothetical protein